MVAALIQRSGPGGVVTSAGAFIPERHRWETTKYGLRSRNRQARRFVRDDAPEKVSRLADGYNRTARDFDHAIHLAGLDGLQLFLVQRARVASWTSSQIDGTNRPKPFKLNLSALASSLERKVRTNLSAKHASLVASGIFIRLEDGSHLINKDYRKWVRPDGSSLLSDKQIAEAMSMRRKGRTVAPKRHQVSSNDDSPLQPGSPDRRYLATPSVAPKRHPLSLPSDSPLQPEPGHKPNPDKEVASKNGVAPIGTRAESFLERERIDETVRAGDPASVALWSSERIAPVYSATEDIHERLPIAVVGWMRDERYSEAEVKDAIIRAIGKAPRPSGFIGYVAGILASPRTAARPQPGHAPAAPRPNAFAEKMERQRLYIERLAREEAEREG
jgi:hypothetical protein